MDYWHEIVKRYDEPKSIDQVKRDDGSYSQSSVVILLIYLVYGEDHAYNIMQYFKEQYCKYLALDVKIPFRSNLRNRKIYTLLKRMHTDGLVTVTQKKTSVNPRKIYSINPRILQSPIKSGTHFKRDGSIFEIPPETIEDFLEWLSLKHAGTTDRKQKEQLLQGRRHEAERIFKAIFRSGDEVDYLTFLMFILTEARDWYSLRESNNPRPTLDRLISYYIYEIGKHGEYLERRRLSVNLDITVISQHL